MGNFCLVKNTEYYVFIVHGIKHLFCREAFSVPVVINECSLLVAGVLLQGPGTDLVTDDRRPGQLRRVGQAGHREAELPLDGEPGLGGDTEGAEAGRRLCHPGHGLGLSHLQRGQAIHCDL